jgi:hypothetical protein
MEGLPQPPTTEGLLFVLIGAHCETSLRASVVGTALQKTALVKSATPGMPVFLFDLDARVLHGPFAADGPGAMNLEGGPPRLPALRFTSIVRTFLPLPESEVADVLNIELHRATARTIDGATVGQLLWLFVLHHHRLLEADDEADDVEADALPGTERVAPPGRGVDPAEEASKSRTAALQLAAFLRERAGHEISGPCLGEFYSSLRSPGAGEACRALMRRAVFPGCKKGLQSFLQQHADLLMQVGRGRDIAIGLSTAPAG